MQSHSTAHGRKIKKKKVIDGINISVAQPNGQVQAKQITIVPEATVGPL